MMFRPSTPKCSANQGLNTRELEMGTCRLFSRPQVLFIELTLNCNLYCHMCRPKGKYIPSLDMPLELFKKVADELFPFARLVDLRGSGESTILKNFIEYVRYATKFECQFKLNTNLTLPNDYLWETLIANNFVIAVSFDAATQPTFEELRRGSKFRVVVGNLEKLVAFCEKRGVRSENVYLSTVVQGGNLHEIAGILRLAYTLGLKRIKLFPIKCARNSPHNLVHYPDKVAAMLDETTELGNELGLEVELGASLHSDLVLDECVPHRCIHPWSYCYVNYEGGIGFCDHLIGKPDFVLGRFGERPFDEVWNSKAFVQLRKGHASQELSSRFAPCQWCYSFRYIDLEHFFYPPYKKLLVSNVTRRELYRVRPQGYKGKSDPMSPQRNS